MNIEDLAESIGFEVAEYRKFLNVFANTTEQDIQALKRALDSGDADAAREAAHSIKGAAANLELMELSATALTIEDLARNNNLQETPPLIRTLNQDLQSVNALSKE